MMHEYIVKLIEELEAQQKTNQEQANQLLVDNSEIQKIVNELRTLK